MKSNYNIKVPSFFYYKKNKGYIYIICAANHLKIGRTTNVKNRFSTYSIMPPFDAKLLFYKEVQDSHYYEKYMQKILEENGLKRIKGEWFELPQEWQYEPENKAEKLFYFFDEVIKKHLKSTPICK